MYISIRYFLISHYYQRCHTFALRVETVFNLRQLHFISLFLHEYHFPPVSVCVSFFPLFCSGALNSCWFQLPHKYAISVKYLRILFIRAYPITKCSFCLISFIHRFMFFVVGVDGLNRAEGDWLLPLFIRRMCA